MQKLAYLRIMIVSKVGKSIDMQQITLSKGKFALVDNEDYEYLNQWKWHASSSGYASRSKYIGKVPGKNFNKAILMHRLICSTPEDMQTDHIDGNKLNNTRSNLRNVTVSQNQMNSVRKNGNSQYKGVCFHKRDEKFQTNINIGSKQIFVGSYKDEKIAAMAYNLAAIKYFGKFARINTVSF